MDKASKNKQATCAVHCSFELHRLIVIASGPSWHYHTTKVRRVGALDDNACWRHLNTRSEGCHSNECWCVPLCMPWLSCTIATHITPLACIGFLCTGALKKRWPSRIMQLWPVIVYHEYQESTTNDVGDVDTKFSTLTLKYKNQILLSPTAIISKCMLRSLKVQSIGSSVKLLTRSLPPIFDTWPKVAAQKPTFIVCQLACYA